MPLLGGPREWGIVTANDDARTRSRTGLVLTAGGARGAYQAGVLKRIGVLPALRKRPTPFPIIAGASAGAINGAAIAGYSADFGQGTQRLASIWSNLGVRNVYRTSTPSLARNAARAVLDFGLGPFFGAGRLQAMLDTAPLREFLHEQLPLSGIAQALREQHLYAVAITATGYHSGRAFTFIQGQPGHPLWSKSRRVALPVELTVDHVYASAAIPIVFPPVPIAAAAGGPPAYFGDGALRLVTPLSPAIRLGAERVFAVGVRCRDAADHLLATELASESPPQEGAAALRRPPLSQICGVFLNAIFLDHLDADVDHLTRMNDLVTASLRNSVDPSALRRDVREPMRVIRPLVISPSVDLAILAKDFAHRMPRTVRFMLEALGTPDAQSADLASYLLFDSAFTRELVDIGYRDAAARIDEIEDFLLAPEAMTP